VVRQPPVAPLVVVKKGMRIEDATPSLGVGDTRGYRRIWQQPCEEMGVER
jgi:hypothetical protein